jgi:predicted Fe-Mo cluster-binding NifX family protein
MHFGHCSKFIVFDVDREQATITARQEMDPPPHEPGVLPRWLHEQGVDVVISGGMGMRARRLFERNDIEVVVGAPAEPIDRLIKNWLNGTLVTGSNACDH